jgi:hypothetical protein
MSNNTWINSTQSQDVILFQVICQRWRGGAGGSPSNTKAAIAELLEAHYYVPVLRDSSFNLPPVVGEVWLPTIASEHGLLCLSHTI